MTGMIAAASSSEAARTVLAAGADMVELVAAGTGGMPGRPPADMLSESVRAIADRAETWAFAGSMDLVPATAAAAALETAELGVDWVEIGLPPRADRPAMVEALAKAAPRTRLVGVLFADLSADAALDLDLLPLLARHGFRTVLLGTSRGGQRLFDHMPMVMIEGLAARSRSLGLGIAFGGSLEAPDVPRLLPLKPDFLCFREALSPAVEGLPDPAAVGRIRRLIPGTATATGQAHRPAVMRPGLYDKVIVRDFVLPVEIGAYGFERGRRQRVRFDVTAEIARDAGLPTEIGDVYSYDVIMDGIRAIVAGGHTELVETMAEMVAARVLEDERVVRVVVRVEKLELGAGGVGVEIERSRPGSD